ncbi:MAG: 6-carboxytetrahydropterin synthase QueD [Zoogloeaceae bacterium]|jgi:6-pyruvoyltetrahydropterin/6-carboxytetrahydropterin synthase|nr:6-carboxytetrahydropterin synthase QueD [Zoogloeaceae bacterium]
MQITRRLEFDAGHRIPDHASQCRNLHGHRYVLEITLEGKVVDTPGDAARGMVMDFADIKRVAREQLVDAWDHAFLVYRHDTPVVAFLQSLEGHKTVILDVIPTAENLARRAFAILAPAYRELYGQRLRLASIRLYETPNCWADVCAEDA